MSFNKRPPANCLAILGTGSDVGKNVVVTALCRIFSNLGIGVAPFKGQNMSNNSFVTLHGGKMGRTRVVQAEAARVPLQMDMNPVLLKPCVDFAILEGVMGLFDGASGGGPGSSAHFAELLQIAVLLVVDAHACSRSAGAIALGCEQYDPQIRKVGVIFNRVAGHEHFRELHEAVMERCSTEVLGWLPKRTELRLPGCQLGLVSVLEQGLSSGYLEVLTSTIRNHVRITRLIGLAGSIPQDEYSLHGATERKARIGVARDGAFCFYYEDNLRLLVEACAEIVPFSLLEGSSLPVNPDGWPLFRRWISWGVCHTPGG